MAGGITARFARWIEPKDPIPAERQRYTNEGLKRLITPIIIEQFLAMLVALQMRQVEGQAGHLKVTSARIAKPENKEIMTSGAAFPEGRAAFRSRACGFESL